METDYFFRFWILVIFVVMQNLIQDLRNLRHAAILFSLMESDEAD